MTRGDQRDRDRARAAKKQLAVSKGAKPKESLAKRKEADAEILRAKQKKNDEHRATAEAAARAEKPSK